MSEVKDFASRLAQAVAQSDPAHFTAVVSKARRKGRIFVDYLRNRRGATAMMPYSARTRAGAPVAAPITWAEMKTIDAPCRRCSRIEETSAFQGSGGLGAR